MRRRSWVPAGLLLAASAALAGPAPQDELRYEVPLPAGQRIKYAVEFEVLYPGRLEVTGDWDTLRVLSFRLEELGSRGELHRRSGPSPQTLAIDVLNPGDIPRRYRLHIRGLAHRDGGSGIVAVQRPQPPPPPPPLLETLPPPQPPAIPLSELPPGLPESWQRFSAAADRFDDAVDRDPRGDPCRWQTGLAEYLGGRRDALVAGDPPPAPETVQALASIVSVVRRVDRLRSALDRAPAAAPRASSADTHIQRERDDAIEAVEADLDSLLASIERGHAPELSVQPWTYRMVSCVIGCERHFEERARVGAERAVNQSLAESQWDRLLEAADLLEFMTRLPHPGGAPAQPTPYAPAAEQRP